MTQAAASTSAADTISGDAIAPPSGTSLGAPGQGLDYERIPFSGVLRDLGADLKHLPSRDNLWIAALGGAVALASHPSDKHITASARQNGPLEETLDGGATLGGGIVQIGAALGMYAVGRASGHTTFAAMGRDLVRAQVLNMALTQGLKFAVQRERPDGTNYSFPSGHSSTAFATATVLTRYYGWKVGIPAYAMATYVGASRLSENKHYLSDVAFGAALGVIAGRTSTLHLGKSEFALAPMSGPNGGIGVSLVRLPGASPAR